jgi:hypothetical protein
MHKINVIAFGSTNFNTSLEELKDYFNFKLTTFNKDIKNQIFDNCDVILVHEDCLQDDIIRKSAIFNNSKIKILICSRKHAEINIFTDKLLLPTSIEEINRIINNSISKKNFNKNSSIKIKSYILNKNEKKLSNDSDYILLTEKEVKLLELFLSKNKPFSKNRILQEVWKYAEEADTHTVETHIYRLRKKIKSKFNDDNFISNDDLGYTL